MKDGESLKEVVVENAGKVMDVILVWNLLKLVIVLLLGFRFLEFLINRCCF